MINSPSTHFYSTDLISSCRSPEEISGLTFGCYSQACPLPTKCGDSLPQALLRHETLNVKMDEDLTIHDKFCSNKSRKAKQRPLQQLAQKGQELVNNRQISLFLLRLSTQDQRRALFFFFFSFILFLIILPSLKLWNLSPTQCKGCFFLVFDFSISFLFFFCLAP